MSEFDATTPAIADAATVHKGAAIVRTQPYTVRTPEAPWSYALSLPLGEHLDAEFVVEGVIRVEEGCVGLSCADAARRSLIGEVAVRPSTKPIRIELLADSDHGAYLMFRTWDTGAATVAVHSVRTRALSEVERAGAEVTTTLKPVPRWSRYYGTPGESLVEQIRVRAYTRLTEPVHRSWIEGLSIVIYPDDQLSRALYVSGLYEPNTAVILRQLLTEGSVFVDAGAHAGVFTMLASRWVGGSGRVFSVEPSPRERARLEEHVSLNGLANVTVLPMALGAREGHAMLRIASPQYGGLNTLGTRFAYDGVADAGSVEVEVVTLDGLVARSRIHHVDVVKFDIEGAECAALDGAQSVLATMRPALILEVVSAALQANGATLAELEQRLLAAGYTLYQIDDDRATLKRIASLSGINEQNIVALPAEQ
jgi:FkbM family methyltransferase